MTLVLPSRNAPPSGAEQTSPVAVQFTSSEVLAQDSTTQPASSPKPEIHHETPTEHQPETVASLEIKALVVEADFPMQFEVRFQPGVELIEPTLDLPKPKPQISSKPKTVASRSTATAATRGTPSKPKPKKTIASTAPRPLRTPSPAYPSSARAKKQQGTIILTASISSTGKIQSLRRSKSSGYAVLDQAAERTVRRWRFAPATKNGVAVAATLRIPIAFRL